MNKPQALILAWLPDGAWEHLVQHVPEVEFVDGREPATGERLLPGATLTYGVPPIAGLGAAPRLRWIQLVSAGVPQDLCPVARRQNILVTNLAGLYGSSIAEHALGLMVMLARNLHVVVRNQQQHHWDRGVMRTIADLQGRTLAIIGLGNIGQGIARLARAYGMRVIGCRRTDRPTPGIDRLYSCAELHAMLGEADYVAVALPLTSRTEGLLGPAEFQAMKPGTVYINVSRGGVAQEQALLEALRLGQIAAAGMDVFATEPLPAEHPLWQLPQVIISPHYSGEVVNQSALPVKRFERNLRCLLGARDLEGIVNLECGY
jgi:phosphoglycerate dehydrogenase-like enzyme